MVLERVDADVHQDQHFAGDAGAQQRFFGDGRQRQGDALLQAAEQVEQLEFAQVAAARVQGQAGAAVDHAVAVAPGKQFEQLAAALDRREVLPLKRGQAAVVQAPLALSRFFFVGRVHQRQGVFGQVRGDAGVDELDLVRLAFEGRIQASTEHAEVALVDQADGLFVAGELGQEAVAVIQLVDQGPALRADLADFPLAATIEQGQLAMIPLPFVGQAFEQRALPALGATAVAGELAIDLQVQRTPHQLQPLRFVAANQVFLDAPVHHDVRVQFIEVEPVGKHRLLEAQAQALDPGMFAGVNLGQQQLEHRLVGRLDALEQLPEPGTNELARRDKGQVAQVECFVGANKALG
ncbi:hypothetical protein D3C71_966040 [compost metagenome]